MLQEKRKSKGKQMYLCLHVCHQHFNDHFPTAVSEVRSISASSA